ncbi:MAG: hypothetical protein QOE99_1564 [Actinomycetota bacterium]|jgi:hypothetical protein|nr:hypothetical protein [Actinomycetota bacterium]
MRKPSRGVLLALPLCLSGYVGLGYGYHRVSVACYESRHSIDNEPLVGGGTAGVAVDIMLWPLFQISDAITSPAVSCDPRPLGATRGVVDDPALVQ